MKRPTLKDFRTFNAYCRAMDEWMRLQWAALDAELQD